MKLLRGVTVVAPEFAELERDREQRRFEHQAVTLELLADAQALCEDLSVGDAREVLWALTGREPYRLLVVEQKWSPDSYEKWLGDLLIRAPCEKQARQDLVVIGLTLSPDHRQCTALSVTSGLLLE